VIDGKGGIRNESYKLRSIRSKSIYAGNAKNGNSQEKDGKNKRPNRNFLGSIKAATTNGPCPEISSEALKLQQQTDPARQEKIAHIKDQIQNGTYKIDHQELAKSIYNYYVNRK